VDARSGVAKAVVSYRGKAGEKVAAASIEFKVPLSQFEIAENEKRAEKMRPILKQLAELESISRAKALQAGAESLLPIHAGRNVDDFAPVRARFVRFTIKATRDGAEPCLDEVEIYGPDGKENLARAVGVKTTASSLLPGHAIHQIPHLTDGRHGNAWSWISAQRGAGWAQVELPKAATLSRVVWSRDASEKPQFHDRVPSQYEIALSSDGNTWNTVSTHASHAATPERWFSEQADKYLSPEQRRQRQELTKELEKLRP
jgi:hypothetical protein